MNSVEILLMLGSAMDISFDEQEEMIAEMARREPEYKSPIESVGIITEGLDKTVMYTGVLLYMWLLDTYGDNNE